MKAHYDANTIESEVQNFWTTHHTFEVSEKLDKSSFYCLIKIFLYFFFFPYVTTIIIRIFRVMKIDKIPKFFC